MKVQAQDQERGEGMNDGNNITRTVLVMFMMGLGFLAMPAQAVELVKNTGYATGGHRGDIGQYDFAVSFTTGARYSIVKSLEVTFHKYGGSQDCNPHATDGRSDFRLQIRPDNRNFDTPTSTVLAEFTAPGSINDGSSTTFTYADGIELERETKYWVVLDVKEDIPNDDECQVRRTEDNRQAGRVGWTIGNSGRRRAWNATSWTNDDRSRSMEITLNGDEWPSAPRNLEVHSKSHNQVTLQWDRPDIVGDPALNNYFVETKRIVGWVNHEWVEIGRTGGVTAFIHAEADQHTLYTYRVRGGRVGQILNGLPSNEITVRTDRAHLEYGAAGAIWSGTLTVGVNEHDSGGTGYVDPATFVTGYGSLSDTTFTYEGEDYVITSIWHYADTNSISLSVDEWHRSGGIEDIVLEVGTYTWDKSDGATLDLDEGNPLLSWTQSSVPWSVGDTVSVRLRSNATQYPPEFASSANSFYQCFMVENPEPGSAVCNSYHPKSGEHASQWMDSATDPNGSAVIYSLEGRDGNKFDIDPVSGNVTTKVGVIYDYETQESCSFEGRTLRKCLELTLKAMDSGGLSDTQEAIVSLDQGFEIRVLTIGTRIENGYVVKPKVTLNWDHPWGGGHTTKLKDFQIQFYDTAAPGLHVKKSGIDDRNVVLADNYLHFDKDYMVRVVARGQPRSGFENLYNHIMDETPWRSFSTGSMPNSSAAPGDPLSVEFINAPESHDGSTAFMVQLEFNATLTTGWEALRDSITVTNGTLTRTNRVSSLSHLWNLEITPTSESYITIAVAPSGLCDGANGICAGGRLLEEGISTKIYGTRSITTVTNAEITNGPGENGTWDVGERVTVEVTFSAGIVVGGTPTIGITLDGVRRNATFSEYIGTTGAKFAYPVTTTDADAVQALLVSNSLDVDEGFIGDNGGGDIILDFEAGVVELMEPEEPEESQEPEAPRLTATFKGMPSTHDGSSAFTFNVRFSEELTSYSYKTLRDHSVRVTQGDTTTGASSVRRMVQGKNDYWEVTVTPRGAGDISIALGPTTDCSATGAMCTGTGDNRLPLSSVLTATVAGPPQLSIADATVEEAANATVDFEVTLSKAASGTVTVAYATSDGSALDGSDYTAASGTLTFAAGELTKTINVTVLEDSLDEDSETFSVTLSGATGGAWLADATATGTITNTDPMPKAWLTRFGRTIASQAVDAINGRMEGTTGSHVTVGGMQLDANGNVVEPEEGRGRNIADDFESLRGNPVDQAQSMTAQQLLLGSSFQLSAGGENGTPAWTGWGRIATGGFEAEVDNTRIDGKVTSGFLGADVSRDRWLAGIAASFSTGDGDYAHTEHADKGSVESSLTTFYPYAKLGVSEKVDVWGLVGFGSGELELTQHANATGAGERKYKTDIGMRMGAVGVRGEILSPSEAGGLSVAVKSDAFLVQMESDAVRSSIGNMAAVETDASRVRLIVETSRTFETGTGTLTPSAEIGLRYDGGDAETGTGVELGGALRYQGGGVTIEGAVRTLVAHERSGYEEWGASGAIRIQPSASGRGLSVTLAPTWGAAASGVERLWGLRDAQGLAKEGEFEAESRFETELGYGFIVPRTPGLITPYAGLSLAEGGSRTSRLGTRWKVAPEATLGLEATHEEHSTQEAENAVLFRAAMRW